MPDTPKVDEGFLQGLYQAMRDRAIGMAPHFQPGFNSAELDGDDLEAVWDRRSMSLEQEWELHRARKPDGVTPLYSREQIGLMVFPEREKLAKSGGRVEPKEWIAWTNQTARRMAERRAKRQATIEAGPMLTEGGQ